MPVSKYTKINMEWAKKQIVQWQAYIDAHPFDQMEDRVKMKETKNGGLIPVPIATIEAQQKNIRDMMKDMVALNMEIEKQLAERGEEDEKKAYGNVEASPRMKLYEGRKDESE